MLQGEELLDHIPLEVVELNMEADNQQVLLVEPSSVEEHQLVEDN